MKGTKNFLTGLPFNAYLVFNFTQDLIQHLGSSAGIRSPRKVSPQDIVWISRRGNGKQNSRTICHHHRDRIDAQRSNSGVAPDGQSMGRRPRANSCSASGGDHQQRIQVFAKGENGIIPPRRHINVKSRLRVISADACFLGIIITANN